MSKKAWKYKISGRVQGVGFRPFIWRLTNSLGLKGYVHNQTDGVTIVIEGSEELKTEFEARLKAEKPFASIIKSITSVADTVQNYQEFSIHRSGEGTGLITEICPDISVCEECIQELHRPGRRANYPFINCTNCGPRFTLIDDFPYDRKFTSMAPFEMCNACQAEYEDPADRRFHAQPTSCFCCGPEYEFFQGDRKINDTQVILRTIASQIDEGKVVALKSLGGYNLACDARNKLAVEAIRLYKSRDKKPLAVMFRDLESIQKHVILNQTEQEVLFSWRRPIVILEPQKKSVLASSINSGLNSLGCFLPYLPLHHLLFEQTQTDALVLTSGNKTDTPIICEDIQARSDFACIEGGLLVNNRKILRRCDDSVVKVIAAKPQLFRRSRGYAPAPVDLTFNANGILATGAELSNCFCLGKENQAILSQHIGDLKNAETYGFFSENIEEFSQIYRFNPTLIVCDDHPDYLSSQYTKQSGLPFITVQHHHAHIASVMAEHGINEKIIGLAWDGTGLGTDGNIWGSEAIIADFRHFERISHFNYIPLPGGDKVNHQPWRMTLMYLWQTFGEDWSQLGIPFCAGADLSLSAKLITAAEKEINSPLSCSAGRLFDSVSALIGLCHHSSYHAEAPMLLEDSAKKDDFAAYSFSGTQTIDFSPMIKEIVQDIQQDTSSSIIAAKFHNTLARVGYQQVLLAFRQSGIRNVMLSGGCFQNRILTEKLVHLLKQDDFEVFLPREIPANDGGLCLGQLAIAAHLK